MDSNFPQLRRRVVTWIADLNEKFEFSPETLFLSVALFDRFLVSVKVGLATFKCLFYVNILNLCVLTVVLIIFMSMPCSVAIVLWLVIVWLLYHHMLHGVLWLSG